MSTSRSRNGLGLSVEDLHVPIGGAFIGEVRRVNGTYTTAPPRSVQLMLVHRTNPGLGKTTWERHFGIEQDGTMSARFEIPINRDHPVSYNGQLFTVSWSLVARLDIPWAVDETVELPVVVLPKGGWGLYDGPHPLKPR